MQIGGKTLGILLLAVTLLAGCGSGVGDYQVGADFSPYLTQFEQDASAHGKSVTVHSMEVKFGDVGAAAGKCLQDFMGTPQIIVNQAIWNTLGEPSRQILIYHELGHCVLERGHDSSVLHDPSVGDYPATIMNPVMLDQSLFVSMHDYYLEELFK